MENVRRVDVLQTAQDLVQKVTDVVVAQVLRLQQLVQVCLHQVLYDVAATRNVKVKLWFPIQDRTHTPASHVHVGDFSMRCYFKNPALRFIRDSSETLQGSR